MPIKYVPFIPEPIEGQAVLANINRILKYRGADDVRKVLERGMPLYELKKVETVGDNPLGNMLIRGECVSACAYLKDQGISVDLVYIDPPFASGADYAKKVYLRRNPKIAELIAKAETETGGMEIDSDEIRMFEEKMYGDIWDKEKYLNWMYENLISIKSVMSETASIFVHLDWHIGHYVKILLDEIFGEDNFQNEIIWGYRTQGISTKNWPKKHDVIFFYTKTDDFIYHPEKEKIIYQKPFIDTKRIEPDYSEITEKEIENIILSLREKKPVRDKYRNSIFSTHYSDVYVRDVWDGDITKPLISGSSEYTGYNTQKPLGLLERIIKATSNEKMVVADFFGGSGVTATASNKLNRRFIHCDIGLNSIQTTRDRLIREDAEFSIFKINDGVELFRNPVQTMDKIKQIIPGLRDEASLDSFWAGAMVDSKLGTVPVYVPNLMDSSTKILDKVLMSRIIHQAIPDLDSAIKKVIVYYVDIIDEDKILKFIKDNASTTVQIELRDLKDILADVIIEDYVEFSLEKENHRLIGNLHVVKINVFSSDRVESKIAEFNQKNILNSKKIFKPITISDEGLEMIELLSLDCTNQEGEWKSDSEIKIDKNGYVSKNGVQTREFWDGTIRSEEKPLRLKIRNICGDETVWIICF